MESLLPYVSGLLLIGSINYTANLIEFWALGKPAPVRLTFIVAIGWTAFVASRGWLN